MASHGGAGALVAITMGLTVYVANDALDAIKLLRADLHGAKK